MYLAIKYLNPEIITITSTCFGGINSIRPDIFIEKVSENKLRFVFYLIFNLGVSRKEMVVHAVANHNNPKTKKLTFKLPKFPIIQVTTLGSLIKKLRIDKDLYQENLASFIDVTKVTVTNWEYNRTSPNRRYIDKLAKFFNVNAAIFLELNNR